jgi:DNA-binding Lrp family transcriptional regulator
MTDALDRELIAAVQNGLPITSRPYLTIAQQLGIAEQEVINRLARLKQQGLIKRFGVIVHHRRLGYQANAMVVWSIPNHLVDEIGGKLSQEKCVNLCYQRPRRENWSYNLYCMIHGKSRDTVLAQLQCLIETHALATFEHQVLFSRRCFKQRGAIYINLSGLKDLKGLE